MKQYVVDAINKSAKKPENKAFSGFSFSSNPVNT